LIERKEIFTSENVCSLFLQEPIKMIYRCSSVYFCILIKFDNQIYINYRLIKPEFCRRFMQMRT